VNPMKLHIEKLHIEKPRIESDPRDRRCRPAGVTRAWRAAILFSAALGMWSCATPDRRTAEEKATDRSIADEVEVALQADPDIYAYHIDVSARRGVVWLTGWVTSAEEADAAVRDSRAVPGVKRVVNEMDLMDWTVHY